MNPQQLEQVLEGVRQGELAVGEALARLQAGAVGALGFAHVDRQRSWRCGFPEVIYGAGKTAAQIVGIAEVILGDGQGCLATRVDADQARILQERFPDADYDPVGRTFWYGPMVSPVAGRVAVLTAGTSDLPVAREAVTTARVMGCHAPLLVDVGVAGLHRLLRYETLLAWADVLVVVAGMEGALPSVVGGLVDCPVIAVPTSVGYGASFQGMAALLGMLSSCAANVAVVNIDGGFCGGYVAAKAARRVGLARGGGRDEPADLPANLPLSLQTRPEVRETIPPSSS